MNYKNELLKKGIKPSLQRLKIYKFLKENSIHPNIELIYNSLYDEIPTLSKTTVYNTMKLFVEKGLALELSIDTNELRYDANIELHGHFMCTKCGKIKDFKVDNDFDFDELKNDNIKDVQIFVRGLCEKCI